MNQLKAFLDKICAPITKFCEFIGMTFTGLCVCTIFLQVLTRYVFKLSVPWQEEVASYAEVWVLFMMAPALIYRAQHIRVTILIDRIKNKKVRQIIELIVYIVVFIFAVVLTFYGARQTIGSIPQSWASIPGFSLAWVYAAVPLGSLFMVIQSLKVLVDNYIVLVNVIKDEKGCERA